MQSTITTRTTCYAIYGQSASHVVNEIASCAYQYLKKMATQDKDKVILSSH